MATKKKRPLWTDELQQRPTSGTPYANKGAEQTAQNTQTQRNVSAVTKLMQRGTGSQTTNTGRGVVNGVDVLQRAQRQLRGAPYAPNAAAPAAPVGTVTTPAQRVELARFAEEQRRQSEKKAASALGNDKIGKDMQRELKERKEAEQVTFGDFLSDPLYAISAKAAPIGRDIEGAVRMLLNTDEYTEREKRRAKYNASLEAPQKADTGKALLGVLQQGIDEAGTGLTSTADFILGAPFRAAGVEDNPFHKLNEAARASQTATQGYYAKNMENASKAAKTAENIGVQAVAAVPDMVLAYLTAGGSTGAGALAKGGAQLAGKEAALAGAEAVSKRAGAAQLARQVAQSSTKNPMFWTSFARTTGNSYEQAKAQGASEWEASMYAIVNGVLNSQVEIGGGIQTLPWELRQGGSAALAFLRSAMEEGNEEVVQGAVERALQNLTYGADNALVSATDENAIINPVTAAKEWGMGAAVGGILGLPGSIVQGGRNMRSNPQEDMGERMADAERQRRAAEQAQQSRPRTGAETLMNASNALNAQNAAESPVANAAAQQGNLTAEPQTTATERETGQIPRGTEEERVAAPQTAENGSRYDRGAEIEKAVKIVRDSGIKNNIELTSERLNESPEQHYDFMKAYWLLQDEGILRTDRNGNISINYPATQTDESAATPQAARNDGAEAQTFAPEDHIDNRTDDYIRKTSTKAFQHEHPELHEHFAGIARRIMEEAMVSIDRGATHVTRKAGGGTRSYYDKGLKAVMDRSGLSRNQVIKVCEDIINDQGSENYADAKRVEMALDALMSDELGEYGNAEYKRQKGEIDGGTQAGSFDAFLKENEFNLLLGEVTEQQLRDEWEAMQANGGTDPLFAPSQPQENAAQTVPTDANGLPEGHGPMSPAFPYREAPTQTHGSDSLYNEEEREREGLRPEDSTHKVNSDAEVDRNANERLEFDYDGEKADLFGNKQSWNDADTALAHRIMEAEIAQARLTGDYSEVIRLQRVWEARGTEQGQALRQRGRFAHTAADIVGEAATTLEGQEGAQEALDEIANLSGEWEQAKAHGNDGTQSMIDLILRLNARRRTGGFFNGSRASRTLQATINDVAKQPGGLDFLTDIAEAQLRGLSADRAKLSPMEAIKTVRYLSMLSKLNTTMRNLVGNTAFDITETVSNNIATPLDMLLAKRTGRRTTALDASWLSEAKRKGAKEAAQRAYIETALDADLGDTSNRFEQRTGRTYKMNGNPVERFLSSMEKWQRYMLTVTDEFAKGGTRAEQQRGIDRLAESGKLERDALQDWAEETAKQRTFQNEGRISNALKDVRNAGNNILAIRDSRGGSFGLGDALLPFAQVPGNIAGQFFNYSPLGLARGTYEVLSVLKNGSNTTAEQQAKAVRDFGRGFNGTALTAAFVYLAAKGLLRVAGDDDKDVAAMERDEGISGTQLNIDAALRALRGESTEWRDGDDLMSIGFMEPFNGNMAMGYLIAEAYRDQMQNGEVPNGWRVLYDVGDANVEAGMQAVMDLPAMSTLKNIGDAYEYSTADTTAGKVADAGVQFAGDTAASFIPNAVAGIAQGMDNGVVRQTRTSDKTGAAAAAENAKNSILSKIPGARSTLPQAIGSWGQGRQTTATPLQNWFNTNILPGSITQYDTNSVNQELYRLMETQDVKAPARNPVREVQDGDEKRKLTTAQQRTYQQITGGTQLSQLRRLMRSDQYGQMRDSERAAAFDAIMNYGKAKGEQAVGGSKEVPSWTEKSDGSTAENAAFYGILQAAKQRLDEDERQKNGPQMQAVLDRRLSDENTIQVFKQIFETDSTLPGKVQTLYDNNYPLEQIVGYYTAANEEGEFWNARTGKYTKKRSKSAMIQYMMETYGLSNAQASYMYSVFNPKQS